MQFKITVSALALIAAVSALQITGPAQDSSLDFTKKNVITWSSVDTDPSSFDIYIVDMTVNPSVSKLIASNIQTSSESYTIQANSIDVPAGTGYQINFDSDSPQNSGILAQSGQFSIVKAGSPTTSASFTETTGTTPSTLSSSASTASSGASGSGSASASATGSSSSASASASASGSGSSSASGTSSPSQSGSSTASGSKSTATGAASKITISGGVTGVLLGALALLL